MADSLPQDWFTTASNNTSVGGGVNIAENCAMAVLNNMGRAIMAGVAGALLFNTASGGDTYTATITPTPGSYSTSSLWFANLATANTGTTPTINFNSLGAKTITYQDGTALVANALKGAHGFHYNGTNMQVLNPRIATQATTATFLSGSVRLGQTVMFETGALNTGTTQFPNDGTIPKNTAGNEYMSASITPLNSNSRLDIGVVFMGSNSASGAQFSVALFQDSIVNALAAAWYSANSQNQVEVVNFRHRMTASTTSAMTFKIRAGMATPSTTTFNGMQGGSIFGGVAASSIRIDEYLP